MEYPELSLKPGSGTFSMRPRNNSFKPTNEIGRKKSSFSVRGLVAKRTSSVAPDNSGPHNSDDKAGGGGANSPPGAKHSPQGGGRRQSFSQRMLSMAGDWKDHAGDGLKSGQKVLPRLTGTDKMLHCLTSPTNPMLIQGLVFLDGEPDMDKFRTRLKVVASKQYRMRSIIKDGRWKEVDNFSIENQMITVELSEETGPLEKYISKLSSEHIDETKPMWQMIHVKNARSGQTVLLFRLHHVIGDGMSCFFLLQEFALEPDSVENDEPTMVHIRRAPIPWMHMLCWLPWSFVVVGQMIGIGIFQDPKHVLHPRVISTKKAAFFETSLARERIMEVAKAVNIESVTTVVLTVVSGAFRRFLSHHGDKCRRDLTAIVPFSTRSRRETGLKNCVATFFLRLPVSCKTVKGRLMKCRNRLNSMKKGPHVFVAVFVFWLTVTFCPQWLLIWLQEVYASRCSLILSTVPGPPESVSFSGKELRNVYGFPPTVGKMSICIATFEYNGQVAMGILMDDNVPEYELFARFMMEEFNQLYEEVVGTPLPPNSIGSGTGSSSAPPLASIPVLTVKQASNTQGLTVTPVDDSLQTEPISLTAVEPV